MQKQIFNKMEQGEIILYQPNDSLRLEVRLDGDNVWLNRSQLAELFDRDVKTIGKHINNALKEELDNVPVVANFATTAADDKVYQTEHYNLDMVISVVFRVKSRRGVDFRGWRIPFLKNICLKDMLLINVLNNLKNCRLTFGKDRLLCPYLTASGGRHLL